MAHSKFEVILAQDVINLGKSGELVKVRPGYARNYLVPQGIALPATARNKSQVEHQTKAVLAQAAKALAGAEALAKRLADTSVTITASVGDEDRLYGAVTARDIVAALAAQGVELNHKLLKLDEPIKRLGSYDVPARLGSSVSASVKVSVVKK
jgi:large subunit ribosomal protein L9